MHSESQQEIEIFPFDRWQPPDWADGKANPPQLSQDRYGSAAMHAAVAFTLRQRAAQAHLTHVASGANWSAPAAVHMWRSAGTVKALIGNLESWWWAPEEPSVPFTPGLPRTVRLAVDFAQIGLAPGGCWQFAPLFVHDGTVPATTGDPVGPIGSYAGDAMSDRTILSVQEKGDEGAAVRSSKAVGGATYELTVGPRGMGLWELRACNSSSSSSGG